MLERAATLRVKRRIEGLHTSAVSAACHAEDGSTLCSVSANQLRVFCPHRRKLLRAAPKHEILLWTGTGEPPISTGLLATIKRRLGREDALRVTYDCHEVDSFGDWCHLWAYRLLYPFLKLLGVY